jgi:uncharacterized protein (TIGR00251 family)
MILLKVHIKTNAKKNEIIGSYGDGIKIAIKAPPIDNKANVVLVQFLSGEYKVKPSQIKIIKGLKNKNKVVRID